MLNIKLNKRKKVLFLLFILLDIYLIVFFFHSFKALPQGINYQSHDIEITPDNVEFLYDLAYDKDLERVYKQNIFDEIIAGIEGAQKYILVDMFLYNAWLGKATTSHRALAHELTDSLVAKKTNNPSITIDVITDPINTVYQGDVSPEIEKLKANNINVIITDLKPLRDSNPIYSAMWRLGLQWLGNGTWPRWIKHPFSVTEHNVSLRSYLSLLNFKANHRKTFLADQGDSYVSIVSSANPHNSSSAHSNVALKVVDQNFAYNLLNSEKAVARMSDAYLGVDFNSGEPVRGTTTVQLLTEKRIKDNLIDHIAQARENDKIKMAMFYLADRDIVKSLIKASERGALINIVLDPNKDAFGYEKIGIPNRQVAHELSKKSNDKIKIRWYDTKGEQFHSKLTFFDYQDKESVAILGSANLTRRNIDNFNLETNVLIKNNSIFKNEINDYFDKIWNNEDGHYTLDYSAYEDTSKFKTLIYRIQEATGLSSF